MSDTVHPPSPSGPSLPAPDVVATPAESSSNDVTAPVIVDAGTSNDMEGECLLWGFCNEDIGTEHCKCD